MQDINSFKKKLLDKAKEAGFESAEFFLQSSTGRSINVYGGKTEKFQASTSGGFSFRGLYNGKMGYFYSETLDDGIIEHVIENAKQNAELIDSAEEEFIYDGADKNYKALNTYDPVLDTVDVKELTDFAVSLEDTAYKSDPRIKNVLSSMVSTGTSVISIGNTNGLDLTERSNYVFAYVDCVAEENGETKENGDFAFYTSKDEFDAAALARSAVQKTVAMLGAGSIATGTYNIIWANDAMADLLGCYMGNFYGENVQKGFSLLKDKLGEKIGFDGLTLTDDPHLEHGLSTTSFDSEGVPTRLNTIIENGVLKTFLHNLKSAHAMGVSPTGNGFKQSFKGSVGISCTNLYIRPADKTLDELLTQLYNGILITELSGLHAGTNCVSGDFSLLASGFEIQDGKITRPVEQITAAGNFYKLLNKITAIGNDLKFNSSGVGSPSVLVNEISIAGK